jgi:hypothetical protein
MGVLQFSFVFQTLWGVGRVTRRWSDNDKVTVETGGGGYVSGTPSMYVCRVSLH